MIHRWCQICTCGLKSVFFCSEMRRFLIQPATAERLLSNPENNLLRGVRCHDNTLFPPFPPVATDQEPGCSGTWGGHTYICNLPPSALKITKKVSRTMVHMLPTVMQAQLMKYVCFNMFQVGEVSLNATASEAALKRKSENEPGGFARTKNQVSFTHRAKSF